jgi:acyl carrier protein
VDKVELFNKVATSTKIGNITEFNPITTLDTLWLQTNLDSLDVVVIEVCLCDVYGISDEVANQFEHPKNVKELFELLEANKTKDPKSVEEALKEVIW